MYFKDLNKYYYFCLCKGAISNEICEDAFEIILASAFLIEIQG